MTLLLFSLRRLSLKAALERASRAIGCEVRAVTLPFAEAAIDVGFTRDLYVALGEPLGDGSWAVRLYYKPLIRWIWLGPLIMAIGGLLAASDRRYRNTGKARRTVGKTQADTVLSAEPSRG